MAIVGFGPVFITVRGKDIEVGSVEFRDYLKKKNEQKEARISLLKSKK